MFTSEEVQEVYLVSVHTFISRNISYNFIIPEVKPFSPTGFQVWVNRNMFEVIVGQDAIIVDSVIQDHVGNKNISNHMFTIEEYLNWLDSLKKNI